MHARILENFWNLNSPYKVGLRYTLILKLFFPYYKKYNFKHILNHWGIFNHVLLSDDK